MWSSFRRVILFEVIATVVPFEAEIMSALVTNTAGFVREKKKKQQKNKTKKTEPAPVQCIESCRCSWCRLE